MTIKVSGRSGSDIRLDGLNSATYARLDKFIDGYGSAGLFEGCIITDSGSGEIDISAGKGLIRVSNSETAKLLAFNIAAVVDQSLTDNSMNYIYIDYNAGAPVFAITTTYTDIDLNTKLICGRVYRLGTVLFISNVGQDIQNATLRDLYRLQTLRRLEWASGSTITFTPATLYVLISGGVFFSNYAKITTDAVDMSGAGRFRYWYRNGSGGWTSVATQQNIDNNNYDDGDGTLGTLGSGDYGVHWVYQLTDGTIHIQYGQESYTSIANARNSQVPASQPPPVVGMGILIGRVIIKKAATTIYEVSSAFSSVFTGTATTQHNDLAAISGGAAGDYYHLTGTNYTDLTDAGDSALHYHSTDRNPANLSAAVPINKGGTGLAPTPANGTLFIGKTDGSLASATLTQGTNVTITNGDGTITIASSGSGGGAWTALTATTDFSTTAASTSTITMNTDKTATILVGMPLKYTTGGTEHYGICTAITASLLTIAGIPLTTGAGNFTALSYGDATRVVQMVINIPGYYEETSYTSAPYAIESLLGMRYGIPWKYEKAYCIHFSAIHRVADTGTAPIINVMIDGTAICTSNSSNGLSMPTNNTSSAATIVDMTTTTTAYRIQYGEFVEIKLTKGTDTVKAQDLTVTVVFVLH